MDVDDDREAGGLLGADAADDPELAIAEQMSGQWEFLLESLSFVGEQWSRIICCHGWSAGDRREKLAPV